MAAARRTTAADSIPKPEGRFVVPPNSSMWTNVSLEPYAYMKLNASVNDKFRKGDIVRLSAEITSAARSPTKQPGQNQPDPAITTEVRIYKWMKLVTKEPVSNNDTGTDRIPHAHLIDPTPAEEPRVVYPVGHTVVVKPTAPEGVYKVRRFKESPGVLTVRPGLAGEVYKRSTPTGQSLPEGAESTRKITKTDWTYTMFFTVVREEYCWQRCEYPVRVCDLEKASPQEKADFQNRILKTVGVTTRELVSYIGTRDVVVDSVVV